MPQFPSPSQFEIDHYQFSVWYKHYAYLCPRALIVGLPDTNIAGKTLTSSSELESYLVLALENLSAVIPQVGLVEGPKCTTPSEICQFLQNAVKTTSEKTQEELVLKQWLPLNPALKFRCFVKDRSLIAVTQLDASTSYEFLDPLREPISYEIEEFYENHLQESFPDSDFVFDVYIPYPSTRVWLMDIHAFASVADPVLFTWEELNSIDSTGIEFECELRLA